MTLWFREPILNLIRDAFGRTIRDKATVEKIAQHGADTVDQAIRKATLNWDSDEVQRFSARVRVYVEKEAAVAYREAFRALLDADIEKAKKKL